MGVPLNEPAARQGVAGLGGIAALDAVRTAREWPVPVLAGLDWPAHLTTAALVLAALPRRLEPEIAGWALAGSIAIDLDHIPLYLWDTGAATPGARPVTHSLLTPVLLLAAAALVRRLRVPLLGLALGVGLHLLRDIGTGPGVPLLWPFVPASLQLPYGVYLAVVVALTAGAVLVAAPGLPGRQRRPTSWASRDTRRNRGHEQSAQSVPER